MDARRQDRREEPEVQAQNPNFRRKFNLQGLTLYAGGLTIKGGEFSNPFAFP